MSNQDWKNKIGEAIERLRSHYKYIGRKTGATLLGLVYPPEAEGGVLEEWHTQVDSLRPDIDVRVVDVLEVTQKEILEKGIDNILGILREPMPGSNPKAELGHLWVTATSEAVRNCFLDRGAGKPVVSLEHLAALHPAATPRDVMQCLWSSDQSPLVGPVVLFIPGYLIGPQTYTFLGRVEEFMYRGDML